MDEIDEWTVGPIPIRPAPGPAAPRPWIGYNVLDSPMRDE